jgi:hypothetical protein
VGNPFFADIRTHRIVEQGKYVRDEGVLLPSAVDLDSGKAAKVYYSKHNKDVILGLSPTGKCLFVAVLMSLDYGGETVVLNRTALCKKCGIKTPRTYDKGIAELVRYEIIAPAGAQNEYYINHSIFFMGNRLKIKK